MIETLRGVCDELDLIDAVIYGDVFDCAVTLDELWRYSRIRITQAELLERLGRPPLRNIVSERDGFYFLRGREELASVRGARRRRAQLLKYRARRVARWLQYAPFVRGVMLTGSVAADDAKEDADVDVLAIVAERRLALAFVMLGSLSRMVSRKVFCPNYYLSQDHLALSRRDHYITRELAQAEPLAGNADDLLAANVWSMEQLPNAHRTSNPVKPIAGGARLQRLLEWAIRGKFGDACERKAHALVVARLSAHHASHGASVPEDVLERFERGVELRFHGAPVVNRSLERYEARRKAVANRLREAPR